MSRTELQEAMIKMREQNRKLMEQVAREIERARGAYGDLYEYTQEMIESINRKEARTVQEAYWLAKRREAERELARLSR